MPHVTVRGVRIFHEVLGSHGPWLALNSGGRHRHLEMLPLARLIAEQGFRVLVHDRRNTGASDILIEGAEGEGEDEIWADDLAALLAHHGATDVFVGGSSAGARLSIVTRRRHPALVRGLLLMRVTGGPFAASRLPGIYYGQFIDAAREGGMAAVCATEAYRERLELNPDNRDRLLAMDPEAYIAVMTRWMTSFTTGPVRPVLGVTESELAALRLPTLVVPGNDKTHSRENGCAVARIIPGCELFCLPLPDLDVDLVPFPGWDEHLALIAQRFVQFMRLHVDDRG